MKDLVPLLLAIAGFAVLFFGAFKLRAMVVQVKKMLRRYGVVKTILLIVGAALGIAVVVGGSYAIYQSNMDWTTRRLAMVAGLLFVSGAMGWAVHKITAKEPYRWRPLSRLAAGAVTTIILFGVGCLVMWQSGEKISAYAYFVFSVGSSLFGLMLGGWMRKTYPATPKLMAGTFGVLMTAALSLLTCISVGSMIKFDDMWGDKKPKTQTSAAPTGDGSNGSTAGDGTTPVGGTTPAEPPKPAEEQKPKFTLDVRNPYLLNEPDGKKLKELQATLDRIQKMAGDLKELIKNYHTSRKALDGFESSGYLRIPGGEWGPVKGSGEKAVHKAFEDFDWVNGLRGVSPTLRELDVDVMLTEAVPAFQARLNDRKWSEGEANQLVEIHDLLGGALGYQTYMGTLPKGEAAPDPLYWTFKRKVNAMEALVKKVEAHKAKWDALP